MNESKALAGNGQSPSSESNPPTDDVVKLKKLYELSMKLSGDPMDVFVHIARLIGEMLNVKVVCLSEIRGRELFFLSVYFDGKVITHAGNCPIEITPCATVETSRDLRIYDQVMERFPDAKFLQNHNAYSYCGFPSLDSQGKVIAVTCLLDDKAHDYSPEDQELLHILGQRIATEMERKHLEEERTRSMQALQESEQRLELAILGSDLGLWDWNIGTGEVAYSDRWASMLGYSADEIIPSFEGWEQLVHKDDLPHALEALDAHFTGKTPFYEAEHRLLTKGGEWKWVLARGKLLERDEEGQPLRATGTHMDISIRKNLETRLRSKQEKLYLSQRLTTVGELTVTLSHELNQPLTAMENYMGAALLGYQDVLTAHTGLNEILNEVLQMTRKASGIVKSIRNLMYKHKLKKEWINITVLIEETLSLISLEFSHRHIIINKKFNSPLPSIWAERRLLQQVFLNLFMNAMDAMSHPECTRRRLSVEACRDQGNAISIKIIDTGIGIHPDIQENIFEPFSTTKQEGIGLGLSICRTIVNGHKGHISANSCLGRGTSFIVTLPLGEEQPNDTQR